MAILFDFPILINLQSMHVAFFEKLHSASSRDQFKNKLIPGSNKDHETLSSGYWKNAGSDF